MPSAGRGMKCTNTSFPLRSSQPRAQSEGLQSWTLEFVLVLRVSPCQTVARENMREFQKGIYQTSIQIPLSQKADVSSWDGQQTKE